MKPETKISPLGLTSPLPLTPGGLPLTSQVMFIHMKSFGGLSSKYKWDEICGPDVHTGMQSRNLHFYRLFFSRWLSAGSREVVFGEMVPQRDGGGAVSSASPRGSTAPQFFSVLNLTAFVPDVARPSAHNLKTKQTKATNTRWKSLLGILVPFVFLFLCAKESGLGEVVFEGKIENESRFILPLSFCRLRAGSMMWLGSKHRRKQQKPAQTVKQNHQ